MTTQAQTTVRLADAKHAFAELSAQIAEDDIEVEAIDPAQIRFRHEGNTVRIHHDGSELTVEIVALSASALYFLKEAAALLLAEIDPGAAETLRWSDQQTAVERPANFSELTLLRRCEVFPGMIRLTLATDDPGKLGTEGLHLKLMLPADRTRPAVWPSVAANGVTSWPKGSDRLHVRYYTVRALRPEAAEIDIDVVRHDGGIISDWALGASPGERIGVMGPLGDPLPAVRDGLLLAGDETALPALARMAEALGETASGHLVAALPEGIDPGCYLPATSLAITVLPSRQFRAGIEPAVRDIGSKNRLRHAWFAGEHANAQALRRLFRDEFGLNREQQLSAAYWRFDRSSSPG